MIITITECGTKEEESLTTCNSQPAYFLATYVPGDKTNRNSMISNY